MYVYVLIVVQLKKKVMLFVYGDFIHLFVLEMVMDGELNLQLLLVVVEDFHLLRFL